LVCFLDTVRWGKKTKEKESNHSRVARIFSLSLFKILSITGVTSVVNDQTFEQDVLKSDVPVLVDFWAPWCGPCRMIAPLIDQLAEEYAGKLKAVKLNTDESPSIATEYGIRSIPTVMIFKDGKKMDTVIGAVPKSTLTGTIEKYL
jgi:thioredoxin 1